MTPRDAARAIAAGRIAIGLGLVVAPALSARSWIGGDSARPGAQAMIRALGVRDAFLGLLTLHVIDRPGVGARTVGALAAVDAVDFGATLAARRTGTLPPAGSAVALAVAGGAAVAGVALGAALRDAE